MMNNLLNLYRRIRIKNRQLLGTEPYIPIQLKTKNEFHGNSYCGWSIPSNRLSSKSVVVDIGLGEDISFSTSLIDKYNCIVHGFDPTPKSINYIEALSLSNFFLYKFGLATHNKVAEFYLPNNDAHVSGSLMHTSHTGLKKINVQLITLNDISELIGSKYIDLLKIDIEGAEYDILSNEQFIDYAERIGILCIEFHHRWPNIGSKETKKAVNQLNKLGFLCVWNNTITNEEYTFIRKQ